MNKHSSIKARNITYYSLHIGMDIREAEIELEAVLDTLVDGVIIINNRGIMRLFNPACEKIFGYSASEAIGENVKMLMPSPFQEKHDDYLKVYNETGRKKVIGIGREVEGLRKDGTTFPMDLAVGETRVDKEPIYVGIIRDLTLTHEDRQKYEELQEKHFHLSRVAAMNEMGSAIAHELNQPLSASVNYMETAKLLIKMGAADEDKLSEALSLAIEQTHRASDIISRMRGFVERGEVEKSVSDISKISDAALRLGFPAFKKENIKLEIDFLANLPAVFVNPIQIQQVFVNLIRNACEAMIDSENKELRLSAQISDCQNYMQVSVSDTGIGLSKAAYDTLFVPFSSDKSEGMGVGLSISQSIVNHHGGQIWTTKNKPNGTVFHFTLPITSGD